MLKEGLLLHMAKTCNISSYQPQKRYIRYYFKLTYTLLDMLEAGLCQVSK